MRGRQPCYSRRREGHVHFSPAALLVFVGFSGLLTVALATGSNSVHIAEALVTVIIVLGVGGYALRGGQRSR
jgi:hypothetical protein